MQDPIFDIGFDQEDGQQEQQGFQIMDDKAAEWAMRKIAEAQSDTEKWDAHFSAQLEKVAASNQQTIDFFTSKLAQYFEKVPHKVTKTTEKYALPAGVLVRKKQNTKFVRDDQKLVLWLLGSGMEKYVKTTQSPIWDDLKKVCSTMEDGSVVENSTGEVVQGVVAEHRPDVFEVKLAGGVSNEE